MAWTTPRTWSTSELVTAAIMNVHVRDQMNEIYSSGRIFTSSSTLSFGAAANAAQKFTVAGTLTTAIDSGSMMTVGGTLTVGAGLSGYGLNVSPTIVEAASGTHANLAGVVVAPSFTNGSATVTSACSLLVSAFPAPTGAVSAASLRVSGAPTGATVNYALLVEAGQINLGTGMTCINDNANALMTTGLTINQGGADNEILALKSSDIAHGVTTLTETDTFLAVAKFAAAGGTDFRSLNAAGTVAFRLLGVSGAGDNAAASTASIGALYLEARLSSGAGTTAISANGKLLVIANNGAAKAMWDAEGDMFLDATSNPSAYDDHEDVALLESFRELTARGRPNFKHRFVKNLEEHRRILIDGGILTEGGFYSRKGFDGLLVDAIRQENYRRRKEADELRGELATMANELAAVRATMARLEGRVN